MVIIWEHKKNNFYIFFGDCDYYKDKDPIKFFNLLISFLDKFYNIKITLDLSFNFTDDSTDDSEDLPLYF